MITREVLQVISPFGNRYHKNGIQVVDQSAALKMQKNFTRSIAASLWRGLPVYVGHPDDPESKNKSKNVVGRIKKIFRTDDGIAALISYTNETFSLIKSGKFKALSPRWQMEYLANETLDQ